MGNMVSPTQPEYWGMEVQQAEGPLQLDSDGYPALPTLGEATGVLSGTVLLRRYEDPWAFTDYASGHVSMQLINSSVDCAL